MPFLGTTGGGSVKQYGGQANLGYFIKNSLRFRSSASAYLNRTPGSASNRKTWTWSGWVKRGSFVQYEALLTAWSANTDAGYGVIRFDDGQLVFKNWNTVYRQTSQVFRDPAAWYHIVVALDTTQATAANRVKMYVNGSEITSFATSNNPTQNDDFNINNNVLHTLGVNYFSSTPTYFLDGYLGEINFIDGQALTPSSFGKTDAATGQWIPKKFAGTYGTNGFYLKFADASAATAAAIGKDSSPNGNNWTPNNIAVGFTNQYPPSTLTSNTPIITGFNLFDGSTETRATATGTGSTDNYLLFTPVTPISYTTGIRIHCYAPNGYTITNYYSLNGGSETTFVGGGADYNGHTFITVASGSGTLNSLKVRLTRATTGSAVSWSAIEVDGVILTNNFDAMIDSPTRSAVASNYPTLNPLDMGTPSEPMSAGNLNITGGNNIRATMACPSTGKWYFEYTRTNTTDYAHVGIFATSLTITSLAGGSQLYRNDGGIYENNTMPASADSYTTGDVIGVAVNCDTSQVFWYKNGNLVATRSFVSEMTSSSPIFGVRNNTGATGSVNFGQQPFIYTPPSGFKSLNTFNLP
jgi:hypothetical protein